MTCCCAESVASGNLSVHVSQTDLMITVTYGRRTGAQASVLFVGQPAVCGELWLIIPPISGHICADSTPVTHVSQLLGVQSARW